MKHFHCLEGQNFCFLSFILHLLEAPWCKNLLVVLTERSQSRVNSQGKTQFARTVKFLHGMHPGRSFHAHRLIKSRLSRTGRPPGGNLFLEDRSRYVSNAAETWIRGDQCSVAEGKRRSQMDLSCISLASVTLSRFWIPYFASEYRLKFNAVEIWRM
uniref:Secreted protein n=1 Tax=Steinernema glaseri TaxID=37863 RepID=A0A1I8AI38_9BILA